MKQSTLGSCIRSLRVRNNLTQSQLAVQLGVTDKAVSKWERDLSYTDITLFPKLAEILGVTVNDLLSGCGEEYQPAKLVRACEVSRDIRMPLHIMLGFVEIVRQNHDDPALLLQYLEGIKASGEYLMTQLNDLLQESCCSPEQMKDCKTGSEGPESLEKYLQEEIFSKQNRQEDYDFSDRRILIVDDIAINRTIAAEVLKQTGAETEFAENGLICVQKIQAMPAGYYDLILMDIMMPEMDGLEATQRIRALSDDKAKIPIIAMTTNVTDKDRETAFAAGMNAFTEKPIFVDKLFATMSQYLGRHA